MNVLIVDDHPSNLKLLRAVLEADGTTVCEATDGLAALGVLQHEHVDAIISDILMPRMDGYRLCMEVRASPELCNVPFIAYTATYTSNRDENLMTAMGADRFLRKPASAAVLAAAVRDVVLSKRRHPSPVTLAQAEVDLLNEHNKRLIAKLDDWKLTREAKIVQLPPVDGDVSGTRALVGRPPDGREWRRLLATSTAAVFVVHDEGIIFASNQAARLIGVPSADDLIGRRLFDFVPKDYRLCSPDNVRQTRPENNPLPLFEQKLRRADGTFVEIESSAVYFQFEGQLTLLVEARDLRERQGAKSRLALHQAIAAALAETVRAAEINQKILGLVGTNLGWDYGELWTIEPGAAVLRCVETWQAASTDFQDFATQSRGLTFAKGKGLPGPVWASGRTEWRSDLSRELTCPPRQAAIPLDLQGWIGFPIKLRQQVVGVVGFFSRRLTPPDEEFLALLETIGLELGQFIERQQLTDQLRQAQKMEAIGTLASGIAHDFNNILGGIYGYCDLAQMEAGGNKLLTSHLDAVMGGARRATDLVHQILDFSQQQDQERRPIQLRHITAEALRLLRAAIPATIDFETSLHNDTPVVLANATQVHQILMNLGTNAAHAMRERGGRLTVKLEACDVGPDLVAAHAELHLGRYARLTVNDTGHGMDAETLSRIYEPLFTTKPPGEGTGLGLAVVRGIVRTHQGAITVSSLRGEGTTFRVYFPAHLAAEVEAATISADVPLGSGERILFVDDEASLADVSKQVLDHIGYLTDTCSNAHQAIDLVTADPAAYALVITDQMMPGMLGTDLAQRLHAIRPDLPIILTTGCTDTLLPDRLRAVGIRQLLPKPLSVHALATAVRKALPTEVPLESDREPRRNSPH